jgi:L-2-amino-thiazoline-4-carboxylic acid hydrolase-like protein
MSFDATAFADQTETKLALRRLLQAGSRLYMHFARETLARFGTDGEATVRQHLRQYGVWRGTEMREAHNALGLPLDMETLNRCWDSASVFIVKSDLESKGKYSAFDVQYEVHDCPAADVWRAEDFHRWGHVYCDEFHQACASTYHPDGNVVIPINMMKGDDHCSFRWIIPAGSPGLANFPPTPLGRKLAQYYVAETPERAAYDAMVRTSRLIGGRYWTMTRALTDRHDAAEATATIRRFLRAWGAQRGALTRARHLDAGIEPKPANAIRGLDLAPFQTWDAWLLDDAVDAARLEIAWTPMDDAWRDLDAAEFARIFWEESLPAYVAGYDDRLVVRWLADCWVGDPATTVEIGWR